MDSIKDNPIKKNNLLSLGFDKEVRRIEFGLCPFCGSPILMEDFRNELSRREAQISGMCQKCQDDFFGKD
ncbi:MAG TPA: hypothetical protein PK122_05680 [Candidatus Paceibacterota bacterium]|jgi:hypothetical protein|nr:hypothetical protein [Candidatus Paceibacterota bacterium]